MVSHGASIVLFFHILGKMAGIPLVFRIAIDVILPTIGFSVWYIYFRDRSLDLVALPAFFEVAFYLIKFSISAVFVELTMHGLEKQWNFLKPPAVAG